MSHISAPGKMFISGEWSILVPGNTGVVAAVNRRVHADAEVLKEESPQPVVRLDLRDFNLKAEAQFDGDSLIFDNLGEEQKAKLKFIKEAIEVTFMYLREKDIGLKSFSLRTWGEDTNIVVDGEQRKVGFGSSAAAVVATVAALLELHGIQSEKNKETVYKLAIAAHYFAQGKVGSGFDVAASTYGGVFAYIAPDLKWVSDKMATEKVSEVIKQKWPLLKIEPLPIPEGFELAVGWTKTSANTPSMVGLLNEWRDRGNRSAYDSNMKEIGGVASRVADAWKRMDKEKIIALLLENRNKLTQLTNASGVPIETEDLKKLADIAENFGAGGKLSGAGGGDCGIAVCWNEGTANMIKAEWQNAGLYPLDVAVDREGIREEK